MKNSIKILVAGLLTVSVQNVFAEKVGYGWCEGFYGQQYSTTNKVYTQVFTIPIPIKDRQAMVKAFDNSVINKTATIIPSITQSGLKVINQSKCFVGVDNFEKDLEHLNYLKPQGLGTLHLTKWLPEGAKVHPIQE
ncbi:hypothetical protein [Acinetobacter pseudolwoffii]|nr:hypothetical protein [Acinetobacter pseudolwoffii]MDM1325177.1 hypothetical protein [Acinetobacter pseudolwoffii]